MHPAYRGLFDYDALKQRSNNNYDQEDAALRAQPDGAGAGFNATMNIIGNQQNKQSPWAPYFQNLEENGVSRLGMDMGRPHGISDDPTWGAVGSNPYLGDHIPAQPLMRSTNIAGEQPVSLQSLALNGLLQSAPGLRGSLKAR